jgi:hypothetical protein
MGASPCPAPPAAAPALPLIRKGNKGCGLSVFWNKSQLGYESTPHNSQSIAMRLMSKHVSSLKKALRLFRTTPKPSNALMRGSPEQLQRAARQRHQVDDGTTDGRHDAAGAVDGRSRATGIAG